MALLIFDDVSTSPLADLMDVAQRQKTADEVNPCILRTQLEVGSLGRGGGPSGLQSIPAAHSSVRLVQITTATAPLQAHSPAAPLQEAESQLPVLLKLMLWMQDRLKGKVVFPVIEDVLVAEPILAPSNEAAT